MAEAQNVFTLNINFNKLLNILLSVISSWLFVFHLRMNILLNYFKIIWIKSLIDRNKMCL